MRCPRIYQDVELIEDRLLELDEKASHHLQKVLRCKLSDTLTLFDGRGVACQASIHALTRRQVTVHLGLVSAQDNRSNCDIHLFQGVSKADRMDWVMQKAVELGVTEITPVATQHCAVKLSAQKRAKLMAHWQAVIISACEQSGQNHLPCLHPIQSYQESLPQSDIGLSLLLSPDADRRWSGLTKPTGRVALWVGPEGGFSEDEVSLAEEHSIQGLAMGPRILRTETACIAALAIIQSKWGDL